MQTMKELLIERYSEAAAKLLPEMPPLNDTLATLLAHRSVRSYLPEPLPAGTIELLVAAGQSAATSSNLQMWSVVAVENKELITQIGREVFQQSHVEKAPLLMVYCADLKMLSELAQANGVTAEGIDYFDTFLMAALDAMLAAQNAVVAAESLGLGCVYGGGIRNNAPFVINALELPDHVFPIVSLSVGVPNPERLPNIKPRLPQNCVLHREKYSSAEHLNGAKAYDALMEAYMANYRKPGVSWIEQSLARLKNAETLNGRDRLTDQIHNQHIQLK
jgi:nitroreductase